MLPNLASCKLYMFISTLKDFQSTKPCTKVLHLVIVIIKEEEMSNTGVRVINEVTFARGGFWSRNPHAKTIIMPIVLREVVSHYEYKLCKEWGLERYPNQI